MEEEYSRELNQKGKLSALTWYWMQIGVSIIPFLRSSLVWSAVMLKNYLKITFRNFKRQSGYSLISLSGLALGMACCLLMLLYIRHELTYDRFFAHADRTFRIIMDATVGPTKLKTPITNCPLAPTLAKDYPEVEVATRIRKASKILVQYEERQFYESRAVYADSSFFEVFNFPFIHGDPRQALVRADTVVITETLAQKYFGRTNPMGKQLRVENEKDFEVTGIIKDIPSNAHLDFDMLISFETILVDMPSARTDWISGHYYSYVRMSENADPRDLEKKFPALIDTYLGSQLKAWGVTHYDLILQPLTAIHLYSHYQFEFKPNSSILYVYIFSAIALFILGIACINFMNLATARSTQRAREVGMRKVLGADRRSLIKQLLGESLLYSLLSMLSALVLVQAARPLFKSISGIDLHIGATPWTWLVPLLLSLVIFTGIAAGSYPAFFLSAFQPVKVLKGRWKAGPGNVRFRHILVVTQFVVTITLIIGTWVIRNQVAFMKNRDLGFNKEQVLVSEGNSREVFRDIDTVKARLLQIPGILKVAGTDAVPGQGSEATTIGVVPEGLTFEEGLLMKAIRADEDFLDVMGMQLTAGRNFSSEISTDKEGAFLLSESAVKQIGLEDPTGRVIRVNGLGYRNTEVEVIGVIKDFHYASLREKIEPILIGSGMGGLDKLVIKVRTDDIAGLITQLKGIWKEIDPGHPFDFFFLDSFFDSQYRSEERLNSIIAWFSGLAIVIACLGLLGLSSFMAEQRTKEIGIRKVLGASVSNVIGHIFREFFILIAIANVLAWPLAYYLMHRWLQGFAFRAPLGWEVFFAAGTSVLVITLLTVGWQILRAATADPVKSLRYE
jgi:putative ABC transport system permease protein